MSFWVFLLQKALFPPTWHHRMLLAIIYFLFFRTDSQNLKFLHWASIFIGNLPVAALHTLLLQYLFIPSSHVNIFFCNCSAGSLSIFPLQSTTLFDIIWIFKHFSTKNTTTNFNCNQLRYLIFCMVYTVKKNKCLSLPYVHLYT